MAKTKKETTATTTATVATNTPEVPTITMGDLSAVVNIIDAGSARGAWRGDELVVVGTVRNKFSAMVKALTPASDEQSDNQNSEGTGEKA